MFKQDDLHELATYQPETPVLSVYLNVDPTEQKKDEYKLALKHMLEQVEEAAAAEDVAAVERYFDHEYDWSGRGVVLFSCAQDDFWRNYTVALPVESMVKVADRPYVWPLAALVDAYSSYMVALVDRQGVRMFMFDMGELKETDEHAGEEIRKLKRGRGSSGGHGRRGGGPVSSQHEEETVKRNLRGSAKAVEQFWQTHKPRRLILAGADHTVVQFRDLLPQSLRDKIIGTFAAEMNVSESEIRERSFEIVRQAEEEREAELVEAVFTRAAKDRGGAIRLADTLGAAYEGRVETLIMAPDYHEPGYQCTNCGYTTDQPVESCPFCGGEFTEIADATEALVEKVIAEGGRVEVIDGNPKLNECGVGALLRY